MYSPKELHVQPSHPILRSSDFSLITVIGKIAEWCRKGLCGPEPGEGRVLEIGRVRMLS